MKRYLTVGQAIPLLTHTCCYSPGMADEPVNPRTPPRGKQLPSIPWLRVVPFLGLAVVHRPDALGAVWSMWSMNDTIGSRLCVERLTAGFTATRMEMPPCYGQNNDSST